MAAMTAATLDTLSGGRVRLGFGVSGPQVSEGWHGVRFDKPLARTREYVDIVNLALSRKRVRYQGEHYTLPLPDGPGKALQLTVHPVREHIPIYLAAVGPKNLQLTGEIADGWLAIFYSTAFGREHISLIETGRAKVGKTMDGFDVVASAPMVVNADPAAAADPVRGYAALYIGGMGSKDVNFYNQLACRMGYEAEAADIQAKYLSRDYAAAAAAVPAEFIDATALLGPPERIAERMAAYAASGVTTLAIMPMAATLNERLQGLRTAVDALQAAGVAE
jgi:F420-dependent oxidoreductase-like protein